MLPRHPPEWVNEYVGIPFAESDCWQLTRRVVAEQLGRDLPSLEYDVDDRGLLDQLISEEALKYETVDAPDLLDLVIFRAHGWLSHLGVIVAENLMLHTRKPAGSVLEPYRTRLWQPMIHSYIRIRSAS